MNQSEVELFVEALDNVQREENFGYIFYFVGEDHLVPFVSIVNSDNDYDRVSNLNREGVYRINIGVSRTTYDELVGHISPETVNYTALNVFLPHPEYAKQHFVCILNPSGANEATTKTLMVEARDLAARKLERKTKH